MNNHLLTLKRVYRAGWLLPLLLLLLGSSGHVWGQSAANYAFSTSTTGSLVDMSSGTTPALATGTYRDDDASAVQPIGFIFTFLGTNYTQFSVNSNGQLRLGGTAISNTNYTASASGLALLAPLTGDNAILATGKVHYKVTGTFPGRTLVVEWNGLRIPYGNTGTGSVAQALLNENGSFEFRYGTMYNNSTSAVTRSVGFSSGTGSTGTLGAVTTIAATPGYATTSTSTYNTTSFAASSAMTNLNSSADGSRRTFTFTPTPPTAPTTLTFSSITTTGMTVGFTDASTTENSFYVLYSADNTFATYSTAAVTSTTKTTTGTAYSSNITGLTAGTTYYYRVYAIAEGPSAALTGSQATTALANMTVTGTTYTQRTANTSPGATGQQVAGFTVATTGTNNPLSLSAATFNLGGTSTADIGNAKLYSSPSSTFSLATATALPATGSIASPSYTLTLSTAATLATGNNYFFLTYDVPTTATPGNTITTAVSSLTISGTAYTPTAPATAGALTIQDRLAGPYTVGTGGTYSTITAAIADLKLRGTKAPVTFSLINASTTPYSIANGETFPLSITAFTRSGAATDLVTFKPAAGVSPQITNASTTANTDMWVLTDVSYITIDGSNGSGTANQANSRNLTLTNSGSTTRALVWLATSGGTASNHNSVLNTVMQGGVNTSANVSAGVMISGTSYNAATADNDNHTVNNNQIQGTYLGIVAGGTAAVSAGGLDGLSITNNVVGPATAATANNIGLYGIFTQGAVSPVITGNLVQNVVSTSGGAYGIAVPANGSAFGVAGATISSNTVNTVIGAGSTYGLYTASTSATVSGNTIGSVSSTSVNSYGLYIAAAASNATLTDNTVNGVSLSATNGFDYGLYLAGAGATLTGNTISNVTATSTTTPTGLYVTGANTSITTTTVNTVTAANRDAFGITLAGGATGATLNRNKVLTVTGAASGGYSGHGIDVNAVGTTANVTLTNNFVANIGGSGYTNLNSTTNAGITGIRLLGTQAGFALYHNSVSLAGTASATASTLVSAALYVDANTTQATVEDNIFVNTILSATASGPKAYALYSAAANTAYTAGGLNYNDYYVGSSSQGYTGAVNSADAQTLPAFRTASGQDASSLSGNPQFTSATDLHISPTAATPVESAGTLIAAAGNDIDNDPRSSSTPDLGADEGNFTPLTTDLQPTALLTPVAGATCYGSAEAVTITIQNNAPGTLNFASNNATVTVSVTGAATQTFTTTLTSGTLASGATQNVTLPGSLNMSTAGTYSFAVTATVAGDQNTTNDALATQTRTVTAPQSTLPYSENFNASTTLPANFSATNFAVQASHGTGSPASNGLTVNLYSGKTSATATTPVLGTTTSSSTLLTFDARFVNFSSYPATGTTLGSSDKVDVQVAVCGGTFATVYTINNINYNGTGTASTSFYTYSVPLTGVGTGQKLQVRFVGTWGTGDYYLDLDNLNVASQAGTDLGATALASPPSNQACYGPAETVKVTVKNLGANTIDFAVNPATVTATVSGAATATLTASVTSGTLAAGATQDVTLTPTLDMSATGTYTFALTGTVAGDQNTANDALTPNPTRTVSAPAVTSVSASPTSLCGSGSVTLTATGAVGGTVTWYSSADNYTTAIGTGTPLVLSNVTATTSYRANVGCNSATSANSNTVTVTVNNPQTPTVTTPVTRCGTGPVTLSGTPSAGTTLYWYDTNTSPAVLASGNTYTPTVSASRSFYAASGVSNSESVGRPAPAVVGTFTDSETGLVFTAQSAFTLTSVDVYNTGAAGTLSVKVVNSSGTTITGLTATYAIPAGTGTTATTVPLNFAIPAGTGMRLVTSTSTGPALVRESSIGGYPYTSASGNVSITSGYFTGATASYYYFYNWQVTSVCLSSRAKVDVNVTTPPALTPATTAATICSGSSTSVTYAGYNTLTVSPTTGATVSGLTVTYNPTTTTTYTITGTQSSDPADCTSTATATITVNPAPAAPSLTPASASICPGSSTTATASTAAGTFTATALSADFNSGGNGFTVTNAVTGANAFARYIDTYGPDGTPYISVDAATNGENFSSTNTTLVSPTLDLSAYTSATLSFQHYYAYDSDDNFARVQYSSNGGSSWTTLRNFQNAGTSSSGTFSYTIPVAALTNQFVVRFAYSSNYGLYWDIDNVVVSGTRTDAATYAISPSAGATINATTGAITFSPTATTTYSVTASYANGCPSPATPITITVNTNPAATTWTGATSTDWFASTNWSNCVPGSGTDTTIPGSLTTYPVISTTANAAAVKSLTIASGATLTETAGTLNIYGVLTNNGTTNFTGGTVAFMGSTQTIPAMSFYNLALGGNATKNLGGAVAVTNNFDVSGGMLVLGSNSLTMNDGTGTITGAGSSHFVVINGTGTLCFQGVGNGGQRSSATYPIGASATTYNPLTLANIGDADSFCLSLKNSVDNVPAGLSGNYVNRQWDVTEGTPGGSNATLTVQWNAADENNGSFNHSNCGIAHYLTGTGWELPANYLGAATAGTEANSYQRTRAGLTSFSPFAVEDGSYPLPVELTSFAAQRQGSDARLNWTTATERQNQGFEVQVSTDGSHFRALGFVTGAGTSLVPRTYSFLDQETGKLGTHYYRLRQVDFDGSAHFTDVRTVDFGVGQASLAAVPNPFGQQLRVLVNASQPVAGAELTLTDMLGRVVRRQAVDLPVGQSEVELSETVQGLPTGVYLLQLPLDGQLRTIKLTRE